MSNFVRTRAALWLLSVVASIAIAATGAVVVLAETPAEQCTQAREADDAAKVAEFCEDDAPAVPAPAPDPAPAPPAPVEEAPVEPAPVEEPTPTPVEEPTPSPETPVETPEAPGVTPAPAPDKPKKSKPVKKKPAKKVKKSKKTKKAKKAKKAPAAAEHPGEASHSAAMHVPTNYVDARIFRSEFTAKGRIPNIPELAEERTELLLAASKQSGVDWSVLAAVAWLDSRWGNPVAGSLMGSKLGDAQWAKYGTDGDGDGNVTRTSEGDQAATVAAFLAAYTKSYDATTALKTYFNGRRTHAKRALYLADYYAAIGSTGVTKGLDDEATKVDLAARLLNDDRVTVYQAGRQDIQDGIIDPRVLVTVNFLAERFGEVTVSSLVSGHGVFTSSGNVSLHSYGQAADIATIGGKVITPSEQKASDSFTVRALKDVLRMPKTMQPRELISLWDLGGPSFGMSDHHDHIHVGYK